MTEYAMSATLKGGTTFESPWLVVYANHPDEMAAKLKAVRDGELAEVLAEAAAVVRVAHQMHTGTAPASLAGGVPTPQPPAQAAQAPVSRPDGTNVVTPTNGWGNGAQSSDTAMCPACGSIGVQKSGTKNGKRWSLIACPNQKSKGDGHLLQWG